MITPNKATIADRPMMETAPSEQDMTNASSGETFAFGALERWLSFEEMPFLWEYILPETMPNIIPDRTWDKYNISPSSDSCSRRVPTPVTRKAGPEHTQKVIICSAWAESLLPSS